MKGWLLGAFVLLVVGCGGTPSATAKNAPETAAPARAPGPKSSAVTLDMNSADAFTESVAAHVTAEVPTVKVRVTELLTLEVLVGGNRMQFNLDRIWRFCEQDHVGCSSEVDALVLAIRESEQQEKLEPEHLVAAVRSMGYVQMAQQMAQKAGGAEVLLEPFAGELVVVCMLDQAARARLLNANDLEALGAIGLNREAVFRRAKENALRRLGGIEKIAAGALDGQVGVVTRGEYYESSQLLDTAGWTAVSRTHKGSLIVAVPAVDVLMFTWVSDTGAIEPLRAVAKDITAKAARPLSDGLLRFKDGKWDPI